jgi:hypothetical protein
LQNGKSVSHLAVSYNQPNFNAYASWSANGITIADSSTVGVNPVGIFVNTNNTIYVADRANSQIQVWFNNSINPTQTISGGLSSPVGIFVTSNGDIYVDNENSNCQVDKWTLNANASVPVMYVSSPCYGLFVDVNNTLYCSQYHLHQVVSKSLNSTSNITTIIAGTGVQGSSSNMLSDPFGIFVDINLDLYVADRGNDRIQLFPLGQLNGTTIVGSESANTTITLNGPSGVVLDADNYLFIVDEYNHRIIGSGPNGFRCLVGCSGSSGSASNQLSYPVSLSFDSYGNMFILDNGNSRIQKFVLLNKSLGK